MAIGRNKTLDRISQFIAQAENTTHPAEAEIFMRKAQELAEIASIDLAVARAHQAEKGKVEEPEERKIWVGERRSATNKWKVELFLVIARANDCKCLILGDGMGVAPAGFPSDLEVVERLYASLVVQMVSAADAALKRGDNKRTKRVMKTKRETLAWEDRDWGGMTPSGRFYDDQPDDGWEREAYEEAVKNGGWVYNWTTGKDRKPYPPPTFKDVPERDYDGSVLYEEREISIVDGRVFRANFYEGFITRVSSQLREAKRRGRDIHDEDLDEEAKAGVALAIRDKKAETDAFHAERSRNVGRSWGGASTSNYSHDGVVAGNRAAAVANYGTEHRVGGDAKPGLPAAT